MSNESVQLIYPSDEMVKNAAVSGMDAYRALCAEADADYPEFWAKRAREMITWKQPFTQSLDESNAPFFKWFADGKLNVSYNCLDRQVEAGLGEKVAIIFEADNGEVTKVTYKEMLSKVARREKKVAEVTGVKFDGELTIIADKNTPYRLLTEILYSCGQAEYANYRLLILKSRE